MKGHSSPRLPVNTKAEDAVIGAAKAHPVAARYAVAPGLGKGLYDLIDTETNDTPAAFCDEALVNAAARALNAQPFADRILDLVGRVGEAKAEWNRAGTDWDDAARQYHAIPLGQPGHARARDLMNAAKDKSFAKCGECGRAVDALLAAFREGMFGLTSKPMPSDLSMSWPTERGVPTPGPGVAEVHEGERFDETTGGFNHSVRGG